MEHVERPVEGTFDNRFDGKNVRELLRDLSNDSTTLIRQESELFRREIEQRMSRVQRQATMLGAGGVVAFVGMLVLTTAFVLLLSLAIPAWAAALIVALVYLLAGGALLMVGKKKLQEEELAPRKSIDSVKQDVRTLREAFR